MNHRAAFSIAFLGLLVVLSQLTVRQMRANPSSIRERFIGTWELVSTEERLTDGTKRPYLDVGPHGKGYLIYTADGRMCAELMNPDRPAWKNPDNPTLQEKVSAFDGFAAYCGRFEINEVLSTIYHLPDVAWKSGFLGTRQGRPYSFDGDLLTFSGKSTDEPGVVSYSITWKKMSSLVSR